ncbi:MAG TPA: chemotaxis protein CheX [Anaeromyxobacteraceae bacterium]|nr:chemotaxis protein CheX [Anaeromyxobacteraceae bacterium]
MPAELSRELLVEVLSQTLEEAAFVFAEAAAVEPDLTGSVIEARLAFSGPQEGELLLACSEDLAGTLAANLLGEDEGGASVVGDDEDALGEMLNMMAGSLVVSLFGHEVPCRLGLPRVRTVSGVEHESNLAAADAAARLLDEEGRRIDLCARLAGGRA